MTMKVGTTRPKLKRFVHASGTINHQMNTQLKRFSYTTRPKLKRFVHASGPILVGQLVGQQAKFNRQINHLGIKRIAINATSVMLLVLK